MTDIVLVNKRMDKETDRGWRGCQQTVDRHRSNRAKQENINLIKETDKQLSKGRKKQQQQNKKPFTFLCL